MTAPRAFTARADPAVPVLLAVLALAAASALPLPALGLAALVPLRSAPAPVFASTGLISVARMRVLITLHSCADCWYTSELPAFRL